MPSSRATEEQQQEAQQQHERPPEAAGAPERDLGAELAQMEDRYKRALADLDNYRKRAARELDRLVGERADALLRDWLEVVDGVERALRQRPENPLYEGLRAVFEQMEAALARQGVRRIGEPGEVFDPNRHEAISVEETDAAPDRTVLDVARSGYARDDRVLRPAQVVVARAPQDREG
jgi:molecular chaperone GrpE